MNKIKINIGEMDIIIPTVPNFVRLANDSIVTISDLPEESIRKIGEAMIQEMIRKSHLPKVK